MIIDGKKEAAILKESVKKEINLIHSKVNKAPGLAVILVGAFAPSQIYVKNKERASKEVGIRSNIIKYPENVSEKEILNKLQEMNDFSLTVLDESCLALFKEDYYQAEKTIKKIEEISKYEKKVRDSSKSLKDDEEIYRVRRLSENIRRISEYASDIAEIVLNMNIEKTLKKTE